jgi:hypothetical protein
MRTRRRWSAALAAAFNDPTAAERLLRGVIRDEPRSEGAGDAYALLSYVSLRNAGRNTGGFATLYQAGRRRPSIVRHDADGNLTLPVSIDGKTDDFISTRARFSPH